MDYQEALKNMRDHVLSALKQLPHSRWYALDESSADSLAAIGVAWLEERVANDLRFAAPEFEKFMAEIVAAVPSLRQERPNEPAPVPKPWLHPITQQPLGLPKSLDEKGVLATRDPELLALLESLEKAPYQTLAKLQDAAAAQARLAAIKYDETTHRPEINPFLDKHLLQEQSALVRQNKELADFYQREARPVALPWAANQRHQTRLGPLMKQSPHIAKLAVRAADLQRQKIAQDIADSKVAIASAQAKLEQATKLAAA